jgi:hypothetical protein
VRFGKEVSPGEHPVEEKPISRVPRVARLLALAHRIDAKIRSGELKNWAEAAKMVSVTRARMTQIANLVLLAPTIQGAILELSIRINGRGSLSEHHLRPVPAIPDWQAQERVLFGSETRPFL